MTKALGILVVAALAMALACGGDGDQLTVREYAEECGDLEIEFSSFLDLESIFNVGDIDDIEDIKDGVEEIEDSIQEYKGLNPPDSLQDLHDARLDVVDFIDKEMLSFLKDALPLLEDAVSAVEDQDWDELEKLEEELEKLWEEFEELADEIEDLEEEFEELVEDADEEFKDLSSRNREILRDNDCG